MTPYSGMAEGQIVGILRLRAHHPLFRPATLHALCSGQQVFGLLPIGPNHKGHPFDSPAGRSGQATEHEGEVPSE